MYQLLGEQVSQIVFCSGAQIQLQLDSDVYMSEIIK